MANMNAKILKTFLIYPPSILAPGFARKTVLPLGIAYLAAVLRNKNSVRVEVVDCIIEGIDTTFSFKGSDYYGLRLEDIRERISQGEYDIVGISCQFSSMLDIVLEICKIAKDCGVKYVIVGGPHASAQPESLLLSKLVDYVFVGEAEKSIADFVDCLMKGNTHDINNISGLAYMDDGHLHRTSSIFIENIDSIPFPARDLFPVEKYFAKCSPPGGIFKSRRILSMITSRGCSAKCTFCASARFWGMKFRARSPDNVFAEIEEIKDKYRIEEIQFQDDNLTLDKKKALQICGGMKERIGLPWSVPTGLALWALDKEIIDAMSDAGCHYVAVAIESGNQRVLSEVIKKPIKLDKVPELCRHFKKRNIKLSSFFITGFPDETLEEIKDTFNFASKCNLDTANFYFPVPLPGSPLWTQAERENLFIKGFSLKNAIYDRPSLTSKNWTIKELLDVVHRGKRMFYLKTLLRRPSVLLFRIYEILKHNPKQLVSMVYNQLFYSKDREV